VRNRWQEEDGQEHIDRVRGDAYLSAMGRDNYLVDKDVEAARSRYRPAPMVDGAEFLDQPDDPAKWRVDGLHTIGGNTTLTAG
jgi:hypothetical protein